MPRAGPPTKEVARPCLRSISPYGCDIIALDVIREGKRQADWESWVKSAALPRETRYFKEVITDHFGLKHAVFGQLGIKDSFCDTFVVMGPHRV
ncbi:unnamed protein product [Clavelina lepadiformis]|uniref:Uncharacterized protein n=1 Tax=Clavelina lepadiformis TaxID=159417 RepID=A0ABP0GEV4_CLALP